MPKTKGDANIFRVRTSYTKSSRCWLHHVGVTRAMMYGEPVTAYFHELPIRRALFKI